MIWTRRVPIPRRVSIADATLASPQRHFFQFLRLPDDVSIADATLASPQPFLPCYFIQISNSVSIADATLASPQRHNTGHELRELVGFNRRRDACFPAT